MNDAERLAAVGQKAQEAQELIDQLRAAMLEQVQIIDDANWGQTLVNPKIERAVQSLKRMLGATDALG